MFRLTPFNLLLKETAQYRSNPVFPKGPASFIYEYFHVGVGICDHKTIDRMNIFQASFLAMKKALSELKNCKNSLMKLETDCLIKIYPNPALNRIYIYIPEKQNFEMRVINIIGECALQIKLNSGANEINISSLTKGIYVIQLKSAFRTIQEKLIKL